jgi:hypothetical protein
MQRLEELERTAAPNEEKLVIQVVFFAADGGEETLGPRYEISMPNNEGRNPCPAKR